MREFGRDMLNIVKEKGKETAANMVDTTREQ